MLRQLAETHAEDDSRRPTELADLRESLRTTKAYSSSAGASDAPADRHAPRSSTRRPR